MLWKSEERDALWVAHLTDLYLSTSQLFKYTGVSEELCSQPLGSDKVCALHLRLRFRYAQWSDYAARLLFYGVLHLLFSPKYGAGGKKKDPTIRSAVIEWCAFVKSIAPRVNDKDDSQRLMRFAEEIPSLFR